MSHVSVSRSYAILVGLESYVETRKKIKAVETRVVHEKDKLLNPEKIEAEEAAQQDQSKSAEKERLYLEQQRKAAEAEAGNRQANQSLSARLSRPLGKLKPQKSNMDHHGTEPTRPPGTGPEDGVPAPEGKR
jgi:hypothetical protein